MPKSDLSVPGTLSTFYVQVPTRKMHNGAEKKYVLKIVGQVFNKQPWYKRLFRLPFTQGMIKDLVGENVFKITSVKLLEDRFLILHGEK